MRACAEHIENHHRHADRDCRIGNVEGPEVVVAPVDVDEVDHRAEEDAVDQVAGRAADDQRQADAGDHLVPRDAGRVEADANQRRHRDHRDHDRLERELDAVEDAERGAAVEHVGEVHHPGDDRHALVLGERRLDHRLGGLVDGDDHHRQPDFEVPPRRRGGVDLARRYCAFAVQRVIHGWSRRSRPGNGRTGRQGPDRSRPSGRSASTARISPRRRARW